MKNKTQAILILAAFIMVLPISSCTRQSPGNIYIKNGKEYGTISGAFFRHMWWNYYERSLSYANGDFYKEAISDIQEAISQREKDQRMARTYGMHFIDYFPHRELGIIHFQMGNFEAAGTELELSLIQYPSDKARFYLDQVRKARIKKDAKEVQPPDLTLEFNTDEIWTRSDPVSLSGTAKDNHYIAELEINGTPVFLGETQKKIAFTKNMDLVQGSHEIVVSATNLGQKKTTRRLLIHVDRQGPILSIENLLLNRVATGQTITISGAIYDKAGVTDLIINGKQVSIRQGQDVSFMHPVTVSGDILTIVTHDRLGNKTSADLPMASASTCFKRPVLLAGLTSGGNSPLLASLFGPNDTGPPMIGLKGWTHTQVVFLEKIYLEGYVKDENNITKLTINQVPILHKKGKFIFFSHFVELKKGNNQITIEAEDQSGNKASRKITIFRKTPKALLLDERMRLTIFPFEQKGIVSPASFSFLDNLIGALVGQNRFRIVERSLLDLILQEQKISHTKLIDKDTALSLGRLMAAQSIVAGSIIETRTGIEIVSRIIDTETSEILAITDVYSEEKNLPALEALSQGMALKIHREFPLVDGHVVDKKGRFIFTDLGNKEIKVQRRIIVYKEEPVRHPESGRILGMDNQILGHARVLQVGPEISKAKLHGGNEQEIDLMHKVITE